jgi:hypothetical protein
MEGRNGRNPLSWPSDTAQPKARIDVVELNT